MAKKTHIKVRMVPESNPDSKFIYYAKKPTKGEKAKDKLKLKKYNPELLDKQYMVVLSKADLLDDELKQEYTNEMKTLFTEVPHLIISSATQYHLTELKDALWNLLTDKKG